MTYPPQRFTSRPKAETHRRPQANFDADVPAGVDPEAQWRLASSGKGQRTGSTSAERAGAVEGYTPGYGRASAMNRPNGKTPDIQWDQIFHPEKFTPMQGPTATGTTVGGSAYTPGAQPTPLTPPPASPAPPVAPSIIPKTISPPTPQPAPQSPGMDTATGVQTVRRITGLPQGQSATSTNFPGQNAPQALAKRPVRPTTDPLL